MQDSINSGNTQDSNDTDINLSQNKSFFIMFTVFFIFLSLLLISYNWRQWNEAEKDHGIDIVKTVDSFVAQASMTVKASIHVNQIFSQVYKTDLVSLIDSPSTEIQNNLRQEMKKNFFNLTGYMIVDEQGDLLFLDGPLLGKNEAQSIKASVNNSDHSNRFFAHHYGDNGGFYTISWINQADNLYGFIVRRPYSKFSAIIHDGGFSGYQLVLYDQKVNRLLITEGNYLSTEHSTSIDSFADRIEYRQSIDSSPWELLAISTPGYLQSLLLKTFLPSILILAIFLLVSLILYIYLRALTQKQLLESYARRQIEQRADKSLMSIDEAVITTDNEKVITYVNPKAIQIFGLLGHVMIIGKKLNELWPDENSLWTKDLSIEEQEFLQEKKRELYVQIQNDKFILEQSYNLLYEKNTISGVVWLLRDVTDEVINRQALEESRTRYKAIYDDSYIAHCIIILPNKDSFNNEPIRIINANNAALELFSAHSQQHLINDFPKLMSQQTNSLQKNIQLTLDEKRNWSEFELNVTDFSGKELVLWINVSLYTSNDKHALVTLIDVTERNKAAAELYKREQFWAKIMDQTVDMVYVLSLDEKLIPHVEYRNSSLNELFGLPEPTNTSTLHANLTFHPDDHEKILALMKKTRHLSVKDTAVDTCRIKDSKGYWRIIRFTNSAFDFDSAGLVCRYISSVRDVTAEEEEQITLIENERRYRLLAENVVDVVWAVNSDLEFTFISSSIYSMLGYKPDEIYRGAITGVLNRGDLKKIDKRIQVALKNALQPNNKHTDSIFKLDIPVTAKNGQSLIVEIQANYLWDENKNLEGIFGIARDVTEARQNERELILAGQVFDNSTEVILVTDNKGQVINANPAFFEASQLTLEEIRGLRPDDIINSNFHGSDFYLDVGQAIVQESYWQGEVHYLRKNGEERTSWTGISATRNRAGKVQNLIIIISDITERKVIERRIHNLAYFDPLTGLPNRTQMYERLDKMVTSARESHTYIAVLFLDLDRFKPINDSMGHPAGDLVLKEVASRLQHCLKKQDLVSRMGGDEFTIALSNQENSDSAANTAVKVGERILHSLQQPFFIEKKELFLTASLGIAIFPDDGNTVTELLKNSDMAMYHAKDDGRNNVQFFDEQMNKKAVELLEMENDLRYAIDRGELELYYQPQFASADCSMQGVEALLRWHHKTKGMIPPSYFIPIIEDTGLIIPIGEWVLRQACSDMAKWQKNNIGVNRIAINVSARQFKQHGFIDLVKEVIEESSIKPNQLELELTESILIDNLDHTLDILTRLRAMGVRMAIDDFGTGYSSLNYLKQFPVDTLKIDQSFIQNLPDNKDDAQITRTIISMAHNLGLGVIAEGVETKEQLEFLQQVQCEEIQGYYFSKPIPAKALVSMIEKARIPVYKDK
ncbi:MAG: diguanylate cyclase (GGDEF)-like protein/PAS domain S-box-containing protein [Oleispira sp.]|jgi:diguanylate cyclase (GGDEF)-like protein/PAS domain S-box-containing protein